MSNPHLPAFTYIWQLGLWLPMDYFKASFKQQITGESGPNSSIHWIDCLEYHYLSGQVHCGTNVRRTPRPEVRKWWKVEP